MSVIVPKRRIYDGDVVNPEDFNDTLDDINRGLADLNEHNLDATGTGSFSAVTLDDISDNAIWRVKSAYNDAASATSIVQTVMDGQPANAAGALVFSDVEIWQTIWEFTWTANEMSTYYAMADVQANAIADDNGTPITTTLSGLDAFANKECLNLKLAWVLDGVNPSEHVRGSLDTGSVGLNMERGFGGRFNAQDVSALFPMVPPGDHTIKLMVLRATMPDEVQAQAKRVNVPMWTAILWEIRR